jgi:soluble lytic murein transglycosylase-like protein
MPNHVRAIRNITLVLMCLTSQNITADRTYVYEEIDGTVWYTNVAPKAQDTARFELLAIKGRPTATRSCKGMTQTRLQLRARDFESTIARIAGEFKVDSKLVKAVVRNESCFDTMAISRAGAQGLMQLMPPTAKELGVLDPFNAEQNLRGGVQYLKTLMDRYSNNIALALAAYNAGPGAVAKYDGVPPYRETEHYIERVMKTYREYLKEHLQASNG